MTHLFCPVEEGLNPGEDRDTPNILKTPFMCRRESGSGWAEGHRERKRERGEGGRHAEQELETNRHGGRVVGVKVLPWVVDGAGGLGAGKTSGAGTRGVDLNAAVGGRTGYTDTNGGESSDNGSKIHADCYPAENPSL